MVRTAADYRTTINYCCWKRYGRITGLATRFNQEAIESEMNCLHIRPKRFAEKRSRKKKMGIKDFIEKTYSRIRAGVL